MSLMGKIRTYVNFVRMHTQHFQQLLEAVTPLILKEEDLMRGIIRPDEICAIIKYATLPGFRCVVSLFTARVYVVNDITITIITIKVYV